MPPAEGALNTIVALSTGSLDGGVAMVRLSGSEAWSIAKRLFVVKRGNDWIALEKPTPRHLYHGEIRVNSTRVDDPLLAYFPAPNSYTGEEVVELFCHAGPFIVQTIIKGCIDLGARMAGPGEFTQRAFLHGRMDLSQAEAIPDLLSAITAQQHAVAQGQMQGAITREIAPLKSKLLELLSLLELELDFSDQDVEFASRGEIANLTQGIEEKVKRLTNSYSRGQIVRRGVRVAIMGAPNAGKSSLLNALLDYERAIVTPIAGTTRDTIEAPLELQGLHLVLIDTAGLRNASDVVEQEGVTRSYEALSSADAFILMVSADTLPAAPADRATALQNQLTDLEKHGAAAKPGLLLLSRSDLLPAAVHPTQATSNFRPYSKHQPETLKAVRAWLVETAQSFAPRENEVLLTNPRHYSLLLEAQEELTLLQEALRTEAYPEILAHHIHRIQNALASITGTITTEDVLGNIFKNFCIGK